MPRAATSTLLREPDGSLVRCTTLPGGLRVITEHVPGVRSFAFGVWVGVGSRDETPAQMGSAHYLEHLLFKGTSKRSALEISASIEAVGGDLNAFTTKEYTCYHARVLDTDADLAIEVVCDVVNDALIRTPDVDAERGVILEEIAMTDDDPGDSVHDEFAAVLFGDSPLGRPVLGTRETIESISRGAINRFYRGRYRPERMVVAAAGNLDHARVVAQVRRAFDPYLDHGVDVAPARRRGRSQRRMNGLRVTPRQTEQANLVLGVPGIARSDERRYALAVLTTAFGGGMSSRLFQEVREKRGLAYSVYAYSQGFADDGLIGVYVGCTPSKVHTVIEVCREQVGELVSAGLTPEELERGKGQVRGATVLGQEDTGARMTRIARSQLHDEPLLSIDQLLARVDGVTAADVQEVAADLLAEAPSLAVIGPFDDHQAFAGAIHPVAG
ncbi:MAG: insulinase family protein [Actinomycetales bacterium]|nr:insulinase family protein [Actinomycetales bacterium]